MTARSPRQAASSLRRGACEPLRLRAAAEAGDVATTYLLLRAGANLRAGSNPVALLPPPRDDGACLMK